MGLLLGVAPRRLGLCSHNPHSRLVWPLDMGDGVSCLFKMLRIGLGVQKRPSNPKNFAPHPHTPEPLNSLAHVGAVGV